MAIKVLLSLCWHFSHPVLIGFLLYGDLSDWEARTVTSVLLILSALLNIFTLGQLPSFGIQINMTRPESRPAQITLLIMPSMPAFSQKLYCLY